MGKKAVKYAEKQLKISDLIPDNKNYNKGNEFGNSLIEKSLRKLGAGRSILLDKNNRIIAGNKTIENAASIGLEDIVIIETTGDKIVAVKRTDIDLDTKMGREMALADNATAKANIEWDEELINQDWTVDEQKEWGVTFEWPENQEVQEDDFEIPAEIKTDIVLGDLFEIGPNHRLLCGDSTKTEEVGRLMNGKKADMVFTDPPYGVDYDGGHADNKRREKLKGDESTDLYAPCCLMAFKYSIDSATLYLWHAGVKGIAAAAAANSAGYEIRCEIVWNKQMAQFGAIWAQYKQKHEPCYYCFKRGKKVNWCGPTNEVTVWDYDRSQKNEHHPTQKPVGLAAKAINNHSVGIILDLFGGSGSTMVACHQLNRRGYLLEIDPKYCQVTIDRLKKLDPSLEIKRNGKVF